MSQQQEQFASFQPQISAAELTQCAQREPRGVVVWSLTRGGRRIWIKRTAGIATWLGTLQAVIFIACARLLSAELTPSREIARLKGSVEAGRLLRYRRLGLAVPKVLGVAPAVIAIEDAGVPIRSELDRIDDPQLREQLVTEVMDDLIDIHRNGEWHGDAQLRNVTRHRERVHRIDFEQPYGGVLPTALLQVCDVYMLLSSALRYIGPSALERLAWRWLSTLASRERLFALRRVTTVLEGLAATPLLRLFRYEHRRIAAVSQAFSSAWARAEDRGWVLPHRPLALRWRAIALILALTLTADEAHQFIYDHDDPPSQVEVIDLEA
jgi:tRNA A-37 threonylcarbamoyl transferase component Bud32